MVTKLHKENDMKECNQVMINERRMWQLVQSGILEVEIRNAITGKPSGEVIQIILPGESWKIKRGLDVQAKAKGLCELVEGKKAAIEDPERGKALTNDNRVNAYHERLERNCPELREFMEEATKDKAQEPPRMEVWKFKLDLDHCQSISMPAGAKILAIQVQFNQPRLWCLVDPTARLTDREFVTYGTGHEIDAEGHHYVGTYQIDGGRLVYHVFEI